MTTFLLSSSGRCAPASGSHTPWRGMFVTLGWVMALTCTAGAWQPARGLQPAVASQPANVRTAPAGLTAEQIVSRHIAARGGLAAWHAVQTMSWTGKMEAGSANSAARSRKFVAEQWSRKSGKSPGSPTLSSQQAEEDQPVQLPFVLDLKRPTRSRVEIVFAGKTAVQVYDGKNGWKLRPFLNRNDVEPFSAEELKQSAGKWDMEGPLFDYAAKGSKVALEALEPVAGHDAYHLKLTTRGGEVQHIWIDAQSFLDVKVEGSPRRMDGKMRSVWIYQHDFRPEQGQSGQHIVMPHVLETAVEGYPDTHKMVIDKVAVNPALSDALFTKPQV